MKLDTLVQTPSSMVAEMSVETLGLFIGLARSEELIASAHEIRLELMADASIFQVAVMLGRLEQAPNLQFSLQTILMTLELSHNVASVVMWAYTLVEETRRGGVVTLERFSRLFREGFPTEQGYSHFWAQQKHYRGASDNWLDTAEAWA